MNNRDKNEPALELYYDRENEMFLMVEHRQEGPHLVARLSASGSCREPGSEFFLPLQDHVLHVRTH